LFEVTIVTIKRNARISLVAGGWVALAMCVIGVFTNATSLAQDTFALPSEAKSNTEDNSEFRDRVLGWIDSLNSTSGAARQEAERALIAEGPRISSLLPTDHSDLSAEAIERLTRIREALKVNQAEHETNAAIIRLHDVHSIGEAFEAISRDSGVEFEFDGDRREPFNPIAAPLGFWAALDIVLDHCSSDINFDRSDRHGLRIVPREEHRAARSDSAAYAGVFRIEPVSITARRVMRQANLNGLNITIELSWEPTLTPIGLSIPVADLSGRYSDGQTVRPQVSGESIEIPSPGDVCQSEFYLPLQLPDAGPRKIESLQGSIEALLPGKRKSFEIPLTADIRHKTIDSMTVRVEDIRKNGTLHEVRVSIELKDADQALESHRQWIFENPVHARLASGAVVEHLGMEVYRHTLDSVGIGYLFDIGENPQGVTFVYESPTAVAHKRVEFLVEDISLP
jgi:hypothetical protein